MNAMELSREEAVDKLFIEAKRLFGRLVAEVENIDETHPTHEQVDAARRASAKVSTQLALLQMELQAEEG